MKNNKTLTRRLSEEGVKNSYALVVWFYDQWGRLTESKALHRAIQLANIQNGEYILEAAVGTGVFLRQ